jgi:hypothetical protein
MQTKHIAGAILYGHGNEQELKGSIVLKLMVLVSCIVVYWANNS